MARLYSLFSSSKGNATFLGTPEGGILVDCGVSAKRLKAAMERCGLPMEAVQAIFITHDHSDHVSGLKVLTKQYKIPVYAQPVTLQNLITYNYIAETDLLQTLGDSASVCGMEVVPFETSHDTAQSCGYRVKMQDGSCCAICTDLGIMTPSVQDALRGCKMVLLEANYDDAMMQNSYYPASVKARIMSDHGHLSNVQCAATAKFLIQNGTTKLLLGHLSQENNTPQQVEQTVVSGLSEFVRGQDYLVDIAKPETDGEMTVF